MKGRVSEINDDALQSPASEPLGYLGEMQLKRDHNELALATLERAVEVGGRSISGAATIWHKPTAAWVERTKRERRWRCIKS